MNLTLSTKRIFYAILIAALLIVVAVGIMLLSMHGIMLHTAVAPHAMYPHASVQPHAIYPRF